MMADEPQDPEAHRLWGHVLMSSGRIDDAVESFGHAVSLDLVNPRVHFELAAALIDLAEHGSPYFRDSHWAQAFDSVSHGLAIDPENEAGLALLELIRKRRTTDIVKTVDRTPGRMVAPKVGPYAGAKIETKLPFGLQAVFFVMALLPAVIYAGLTWNQDGADAIGQSTVLTTAILLVVSTLLVRVFLVYPLKERQQTIVRPR